MRWGEIYEWVGILGVPIDGMTLAEFWAARDGWLRINGAGPRKETLSTRRLAALGIEGFED
jgi:hypothetical protein